MRTGKLKDERYPAISDLRKKGQKMIPHFAWEYLDSGTGEEEAMHRSQAGFKNITLVPEFMKGNLQPTIDVELFGQTYDAPIGIPPIGYTSLMWPGAEMMFARTAAKNRIAHCLSTMASDTPENCGPEANGQGWFQLYPPKDRDIRNDILKRAKESGYRNLVVTCDVPAPSMRERQRRAGISIPPKLNPRILSQIMVRPKWALATLKRGRPTFAVMEQYMAASGDTFDHIVDFVGQQLAGSLDWEYLKEVRDIWDGSLSVKGVLANSDAEKCLEIGCDGIWVSNHGGRQLEAAPAAIDVLADIKSTVGDKAKIIFDSGIRSGGDILKAFALGADFVFAGRPFMYGVTAMGEAGAQQAHDILVADMLNSMHQLGIDRPEKAKDVELKRVDYAF